MLYAADLRADIAQYLAEGAGCVDVNEATRETFASSAEAILDKVLAWLADSAKDLNLDNAHRSHVAYVRHILSGGEHNQKQYSINSYRRESS